MDGTTETSGHWRTGVCLFCVSHRKVVGRRHCTGSVLQVLTVAQVFIFSTSGLSSSSCAPPHLQHDRVAPYGTAAINPQEAVYSARKKEKKRKNKNKD